MERERMDGDVATSDQQESDDGASVMLSNVEADTLEGQSEDSVVESEDAMEGAVEAEEESPDYKALFEEAEAARQAMERRAETVRSQEIGLLKQAQRDELLRKVVVSQQALAESIAQGSIEEFPGRLAQIQEEKVKSMSRPEFVEAQNRAANEVAEATADLGVDPQSAQEFGTARLYWDTAVRTGDKALLERSVAEVHRTTSKLQASSMSRAADAARREGRAVGRREALGTGNGLALDTGTGAAGSGDLNAGLSPVAKIQKGLDGRTRSRVFTD